ncbi:hypothetical protein AMJ44_06455 [candidate division WOR-1 bacterium DG_54_3]|jgi:hypothetical protein|uniref:Uncharacterized protein n=1 Tax=candidate division WOR-1 bacterium DG_54_3 TaxID=1703775 RepID=A0A0S7Y1P1_UNCSA|nr:MAG: hypothetical protein AMJ44_06455 [candidate division WOR-1 bacterium DG_54_3]
MAKEEEKILKEEKEILQEEKSLLKALNSKIGRLASSLERARIDEYTSMLTRPWRFFFFNFLVGVFRGLGIAVGLTIIAAVVLYVLSKILVRMVDLPIIGMYIAEVVKFVEQYLKQGMPAR